MSLKILRFNRIDIDFKSQERKEDNYSCYRTILLIIAFDLFKHISHKSCCQGMVWFDADRLVFGRYYFSVVSAGTLACRK